MQIMVVLYQKATTDILILF